MRLKSVIMTGGLAGAAFVIAGHAAAESAGAPSTNAQIRAQQAQIDYMKRQIQLMQDKLDQMQAATKATQQTVQATAAAIAQPAPRVTESATHRLAIESADGQYSIGLTGRLHLDIGDYANFDPKSKYVGPQDLNSGFDARRARIGVVGKVAGDWTYGLIYDFGNSADNTNAGIQTAQIAYSGFKDFSAEFGYSDTFFTLDGATPQVVAANVNTGDFRSNAGVRYMNDRFWLGAYFTGPKNGDVHNQGETIGAFQRATVQALQDPDYSLHLGVGVDEIIKAAYAGGATATAPSTNTFALSDQPDLRIDTTTLLNTGQLGSVGHPVTGGYIADVEAAGGIGSLFAQGEYFHYSIDRTGLKTAEFDGEYGEASYTLTGESRKYKKDSGAYSGIVPDHPFSLEEGTWGAFEVAGRVSYIDLTSNFTPGLPISSTSQPSAVNGGKQTSFTAGLNWYPNSYMRFMLDYVHVDFDKANPSTAGKALIGSPVGATMDAIALRSQVAW
jgi:phosphate-selective porin OprO/OprP